jgi:hypothetical protein
MGEGRTLEGLFFGRLADPSGLPRLQVLYSIVRCSIFFLYGSYVYTVGLVLVILVMLTFGSSNSPRFCTW